MTRSQYHTMRRHGGHILIPVVLMLSVIASVAYLINLEGSISANAVGRELESTHARFVAEAGYSDAKWQLLQNTSCTGYMSLPVTAFGQHSYRVDIAPTSGSPVLLSSSGLTNTGAGHIFGRAVRMYQAPTTAVLQPGLDGSDTFIQGESGKRNLNEGNLDELWTSSEIGKEYRTLIKFDLSLIPPGASVHLATLELELQSLGSVDTVTAHRVLSDWSETEATWNSRSASDTWTTPGGDYEAQVIDSFTTDSIGVKALDITSAVSAWTASLNPNYGLLLQSQPASGGSLNKYHSSDKPDEFHPKLTVTYACECGVSCVPPAP